VASFLTGSHGKLRPNTEGISTASTLADEVAFPNLARMPTSETGVSTGFAAMCKQYGWNRVAIVHDSSVWGADSAKQFEAAMLADEGVINELIHMDFAESTLNRSLCSNYVFDSSGRGMITDAKEGCEPLTSVSSTKIRAGYPNGGDDLCNLTNPDHFCVETILTKLKDNDAKIIFLALQRDTQRALFRAVYQHRNDPAKDLYGEGYAFMSPFVDTSFFQSTDGGLDMDAYNGALGVLAVIEAVDQTSTTFKEYTSLWGEASSKQACCTDATSRLCKRESFINRTIPTDQAKIAGEGTRQYNYCDVDGDGTTPASYSFSVADGTVRVFRQRCTSTLKDAIGSHGIPLGGFHFSYHFTL
jgi:hypothetical protein